MSATDRRSISEAVVDALAARANLRDARREYHEALVSAELLGASDERLATALDTRAAYIANAVGRHLAGTCGCDNGYPGDET
jgi:hypothetical protein